MINRREFIKYSGGLGAALLFNQVRMPHTARINDVGVQLYSFRDEMLRNAEETLGIIADLGFKEIESARSNKGLYYGLTPSQIKSKCNELGLVLRSGHVHLDDQWKNTLQQAAEAGQEYVICSTMPTNGQTIENYQSVAEAFNMAGEDCREMNLKFGYHNHEYEFEEDRGKILYDVLMDETDPSLVHMELDLGWVVAAGQDPLEYFKKYPGRFPLWHLKDMDLWENESTEFGKGGLDIPAMISHMKQSGVKHVFIEQEEYASSPEESMRHNLKYLADL